MTEEIKKEVEKGMGFFKITAGSTNWFFVILVFLAGIGSATLIYFTFLAFDFDIEALINEASLKSRPASFTLATSQQEFKLNDLIEVNILLNTGKRTTTGIDVALKYDPEILELQPKNPKTKIPKNGVINPHDFINTEFSSFDIFPYFKLNNLIGSIFFSALAKPLREVLDQGVVGALTFKALKQGETSINLIFEKGAGNDSNIAYRGKDVLAKVYDLNLKIR